jgi:hypothetical protein
MPTILSSKFPPPKSWDEFEDMTLAAAKLRWRSTDFFRNGRQGQKQDGVDVWGHSNDGQHLGIQCKNSVDGIALKLVQDEVSSAESFEPAIERLYVATTAARDAQLQKSVREMSKQRGEEGKFEVDVLFWDDIYQDLSKDEMVFFGFYPQFQVETDSAKTHDGALFKELTTLLNSDGVIGFLDRNNMAGFSFASSSLDPIEIFYAQWNSPEREFIDSELEALRKRLWSKSKEYLSTIRTETFPTNSIGRLIVPPEWEFDQPERFSRTVDALHSLAGDIVAIHADLVRTGRTKLRT